MGSIPFDNSYARLPDLFYTRQAPTPVRVPGPIAVNRPLAEYLGIDPDWLASPEGTDVIAGNTVPELAEPLAAVYAGHQFGSYNPQLGDGRAVLLGEVVTLDGQRFDIQLKGSGPTPYSRGGDGRSPMGPVIREYLLSEAFHALGIPSTRALAAVSTGEDVFREYPLPGAVMARVASSHIRIGTFQFFAARGEQEALQTLSEYALQRHYPDQADAPSQPLALLNSVISAQAELVAQWMCLGFIHGVMNTDNMLIGGETVDFGPCAFMDEFSAGKVFSSIDQHGRYAYANQPAIAHWNLATLAQALLPLLHESQEEAVALAQAAVDSFPGQYQLAHHQGMANKFGLAEITEPDNKLIEDFFALLEAEKCDFTLAFRRLYELARDEGSDIDPWFEFTPAFELWLAQWRRRLTNDPLTPETRAERMRLANPVFIPRNHRVEEAIRAAEDEQDFRAFHALGACLEDPYTWREDCAHYAVPPMPQEMVQRTFCGT